MREREDKKTQIFRTLDSECRDKFEVSNLSTGNFRVPTLCGFNTGEHSKLSDFMSGSCHLDRALNVEIGS